MFLREQGIAVDADEFAAVFERENANYLLHACSQCDAEPLRQHALDCPFASVLWYGVEWYQEMVT